jgi:hypothetical protein
VVDLLFGGGIYDEKFSRGRLRSRESRVFISRAEMKLLFVTVISGEKCMFFYHFLYEREATYLSSETICSLPKLLILSL